MSDFNFWANKTRHPISQNEDTKVQSIIKSSRNHIPVAFYYNGGINPRRLRLVNVESVFRVDDSTHLYVSAYCHLRREHRVFRMDKITFEPTEESSHKLRPILTGRSEKAINLAAKKSFFPLLKKIEKSPEIKGKMAVIQDPTTHEIEIIHDYRAGRSALRSHSIDWFRYYPYQWNLPFAAYLIPPDIQIGERVILTDLIEDYIGKTWNQGDTYRADQAEAVWNGEDFEIDENSINLSIMMG